MNPVGFECAVCQQGGQTLRCSSCQLTYYCSRDHQKQDWKRHKPICKKRHADKIDANQNQTTITYEGSSENEILNAQTQSLDYTEMPPQHYDANKPYNPDEVLIVRTPKNVPAAPMPTSLNESFCDRITENVIRDLETFGVCVVDNFLGKKRGVQVLEEVLNMYKSGVFKDGQLVSSTGRDGDHKTIRGDQITWIDGNEGESVTYIGQLIRDVDMVIKRANRMSTGRLSKYTINGRTKAMVACYPGSGAHYVKHVDNPNSDGRCVTAIYYLNMDWDAKRYGGLLRIFPEGSDKVADIEPFFDRLLFFWSDRSNPHEVQPAFQTRYAITLWYFDAHEREQACKRFKNSNKPVKAGDGGP